MKQLTVRPGAVRPVNGDVPGLTALGLTGNGDVPVLTAPGLTDVFTS